MLAVVLLFVVVLVVLVVLLLLLWAVVLLPGRAANFSLRSCFCLCKLWLCW